MITRLCDKKVSPIGIGTWGIGGWIFSDNKNDKQQITAIRFAVENGINIIDTAELYGRGHAEELIRESIKGVDRESLFIISKVWPTHLSNRGIRKAVNASLARLGMKYLDMYLIHWPNPVASIKGAIGTMEELVDDGVIRSFGVSNFGVTDMQKAIDATKKYEITANQIEYSLLKKDAEEETIPFCQKNKIAVIAHTPLGHGRLAESKELEEMSKKYKKPKVQVALNYLMRSSLPIPRSSNIEHLKEIIGSTDWSLEDSDYKKLRGL
ncbi:MAG: aldo/keto reductase [Candidatus Micrarchaeota archaeon]|nr:aldo/keto reductase [Candidatus Micrarchaeota archaeon]MDE1848001.1 aldo/keto reductase [Candidatus Micrarchaeota archaeon]MDE1864705.1 aldo/keto reductase [Candidatus Micrarchaeota archaeon]